MVKNAKSSAKITIILLGIFMTVVSVNAHMPGARPPPEFELEPIVLVDGGRIIEITIDDIGEYHHERMKEIKTKMLKQKGKTDEEIAKIIEKEFGNVSGREAICVCAACAFRAAQLGIAKVWGDEIPERNDIKIISRLPTMGSIQCFQYITGTGPKVPNVTNKGEFHLNLVNGTEITDFSIKNVKPYSRDINISWWNFIIIRKSTGEEFEVRVKEDVFPEGFFELRKKIKSGIPKVATGEEVKEFTEMWEEVRDAFLTHPDSKLFEGIEEPSGVGGTIFVGILVTLLVGGVYWLRTKI